MTNYEKEEQVIQVALAGLKAWEEIVPKYIPSESTPPIEWFLRFTKNHVLRESFVVGE